jgi:hypothetical protein
MNETLTSHEIRMSVRSDVAHAIIPLVITKGFNDGGIYIVIFAENRDFSIGQDVIQNLLSNPEMGARIES